MVLKDNATILILLLLLLLPILHEAAEQCDFFTGQWVKDASYPLYDASTCPFVRRQFTCKQNGRPDLDYTTFRWQPQNCKLARFDGRRFLEKNRGKKIMFVGDSLSLNQWQSLTCMLHSSVPNSPYNTTTRGNIETLTFTEYGVEVKLDKNRYLVDIKSEKIGRVLKLDSISDGKNWAGMDTLIFNTWHWWSRRGPSQPFDWIQVGTNVTKDMDRTAAFEIALGTWGKWVDTVVNTRKTKVYFQGISPAHYRGASWGEPKATSCLGQKEPLLGTNYPEGLPAEVGVLKRALKKISKPVTLLDITLLSLLRKDGHPSAYVDSHQTDNDCSHWCLSGVPDTWNEILFNYMKGCDFFTGHWVKDASYPLYDPSTCPFIRHEFSCKKNGRPDLDYSTFRWQPLNCNLQRFNGKAFLEKNRGKKIMFVGDSLSLNQWQSLNCMLHSSVPKSPYTVTTQGTITTFTFQEYALEVKLDQNKYLVDIKSEKIGRVLNLDSISDGKNWVEMDTLIFNTWHWWGRRGAAQPWDLIQTGSKVVKDMNRVAAFELALGTWGKWVDTAVNTQKTKVYFQGISPVHTDGSLWGEPKAKSCVGQKEPLLGTSYPGGLPIEVGVVKRALQKITKPVILLDITLLSLLRKDAHPSIYGQFPAGDCGHWCLSGVPDTWNEILYNYMI